MLWWLYRQLFDYGLSQTRTVSTFVTLVLFGWAGAYVADHGSQALHIEPVLVVQANPVHTVAVPASEGKTPELGTIGFPVGKGVVEEIPCGSRINPFIYAFTTFVPILELHEERVCEISQELRARYWRIGKFGYSLLGWIVSSITLLALPGFLRARAEK